MLKKKKSFYCLYKECGEDKFQLVLLVKKSGVVSLDFLFEKSAELDLEHIFSPEGGSWNNIEFFLSEFLKKRNSDHVWILSLAKYNEQILNLSKADLVYSMFEKNGRRYPDQEGEKSLRDRFLKL